MHRRVQKDRILQARFSFWNEKTAYLQCSRVFVLSGKNVSDLAMGVIVCLALTGKVEDAHPIVASKMIRQARYPPVR